jgi:uncharacterized protein
MFYALCGGTLITTLLAVFTLVSGRVMTRRRPPDAPDSPTNYNIPYEDVTFQSRYKAPLKGWWLPAEDAKGTVIFSHGQAGSMAGDLPEAAMYHKNGYNVLMFDYRAHGTSDGDRVTFGVYEKEDLLGAIDFLQVEKGIDRVALIGFSMGAAVAMITAALTDRVSTLILDGVFWRLTDVLEAYLRRYTVPPGLSYLLAVVIVLGASVRTNTRMYQVSPRLWAKHLDADIPVLFIHGEQDNLVRLADLQKLIADLKGKYDLWVAPDSNHREAFSTHPNDYEARVMAWLAENA